MPHEPAHFSRQRHNVVQETATPPEGPPAGTPELRPPRGFESEKYPLRHRLLYSVGLSTAPATKNSCFFTILRHTNDVIAGTPASITPNPHNSEYDTDAGPAVAKMSIIDKVKISLRFNATSLWADKSHTSGTSTNEVFSGDSIYHLKLLWRPIFFSFPEKLDAADDVTTTTVAAILALTKDATFEDVVPLTTTKLPAGGPSEFPQPVSTVNIAEDLGDYNMTTDLAFEEHVWDETVFQDALRRYTNKGALKACVGRTRHVHLSRERPFKSFFIDKFVPRAVRRIVPYSFFGIQIYLPTETDIGQDFFSLATTSSGAQIGVKMIATFHEWNILHNQDRGTPT